MRESGTFSAKTVKAEADRLAAAGLGAIYPQEELLELAPLTLKINRLKKEKNAVIAGHVYQRPEILAGIADFTGDSYRLAQLCRAAKAKTIVFCGVRFMAETAKAMNPDKTVLLPSPQAGCTLAESITAKDIRALKARQPGAPVVSYINTGIAAKAESDCIVTSANAEKILAELFKSHKKIIFLPDKLMGLNLAKTLRKKPGKELLLWRGTCIVHERFNPALLAHYRKAYPGLRILCHPECDPAIVAKSDFAGGTSVMLDYIGNTQAPHYLLLTECGLAELAKMQFPRKNFISMCRLCPYMKYTTLHNALQALESPTREQIIKIPPRQSGKAVKSIERMFELAAR